MPTTHKATDRTAKLVVEPEAQLTKETDWPKCIYKNRNNSGSKSAIRWLRQKPTGLPTTHKATDRTAKLVADAATAQLTKVRPLGLTFFLCNKTIKQSN